MASYLPHVAGQTCWSAEGGHGQIEPHRRSFEVTNRRDLPAALGESRTRHPKRMMGKQEPKPSVQ